MIEQRSESVMTSSSVSYQSSGFYPSDHTRPLSAERKSPSGVQRTPIEDAMIREMSSKMEKQEFQSNEESKWQYAGNGFWQNGQQNGGNGLQNGQNVHEREYS